MDRVIIFDTTLRDGEQAAGGTLNVQEKLDIARQLERLGVDVIEAGFPISSPGGFEAVRLIAKEVRTPAICALARARVGKTFYRLPWPWSPGPRSILMMSSSRRWMPAEPSRSISIKF